MTVGWAPTLTCGSAGATAPWLTVVGDQLDPAIDTVQVDPVAQDVQPRRMKVRVNRAEKCTSWDGVPYRSYSAEVQVDCDPRSARYVAIDFDLEPIWQGGVHRRVDYSAGAPRRMEFTDMSPNPMARLIAAACPHQLGPRPVVPRPPAAAPCGGLDNHRSLEGPCN